ncbi:MAG: FAD-dependent oxidoreductase, partial [Kiritimatiellae bacterium]|nr:FAD-dependent oxidoreductase [Kiritimatiellia bacterium]
MVETETFPNKGGWVLDQQFMDQMGSPFLLAHGLGIPVEDAETTLDIPEAGRYRILARTRNWVAFWSDKGTPGQFQIRVNGALLPTVLGTQGKAWGWHEAGSCQLPKGPVKLALHDLTGFDARCDALLLTSDPGFTPPETGTALENLRKTLGVLTRAKGEERVDLIVAGGGVAGTCAALSAARLGLTVALLQDRPVLCGCNSSEVRVHLGGRANLGPYPKLGDVVNEIGPAKGGNAQPANTYEDQRKLDAVAAEKNIRLFLNTRAIGVERDKGTITAVIGRNIETGIETRFVAPLVADCTGDGAVGVLAGAEYRYGRESKAETGESTAVEKADTTTMGASVQWYSRPRKEAAPFPDIPWALPFTDETCERVKMGEWTWETGMTFDQINEFERIRDYGMLVVYSNWAFLKNRSRFKAEYANLALDWVAYVAGKRESRRLIGDHVLCEQDVVNRIAYPDGTACSTWSVDLHYPDPKNSANFPGMEFKSIAKHQLIHPYPIPYRCLYSKNVSNLFMAGRNISVTHVALGTVRVMRTTGMMGEVVGMAAAVCTRN